ncbi:MAG: four helix bundle protein [Kiritimatiellaeota bacterium]|nr:four helix bundle protein [Kiritimatiellota bacterium]
MDRKEEFRRRTKRFAVNIIRFYCTLPKARPEVQVVGKQLLRSGTAVAANYREASRARSKADFISKIELCTQEADETQLWLELLQESCAEDSPLRSELWQEADELIAIFVTMAKNTKGSNQTS